MGTSGVIESILPRQLIWRCSNKPDTSRCACCFQPDSSLDTMRLREAHGSRVSKGLFSYLNWFWGTPGFAVHLSTNDWGNKGVGRLPKANIRHWVEEMVLQWINLGHWASINRAYILRWHSSSSCELSEMISKTETWRLEKGHVPSTDKLPFESRCLSWSYGLINERFDTCLLWGCASTSERRKQISRKDIYRASPIRPTDKWLSMRDLIIVSERRMVGENSGLLPWNQGL
jgi:hypothetical protein